MKKNLPILVLTIVILGGVYLAKSFNKTSNTSTSPTSSSSAQTASNPTSACPPASPNTVSYCHGKFNDLTVPAGTAVTFINNSSSAVQPDSDPHPAHTDNTELNIGFMNAGQSKTVTLTKPGTWGIHNHLRESETATITVQ